MHAKMRYMNTMKDNDRRRRLAEEAFDLDREEDEMHEIEDQLEADVRYFWKQTRKGWHDDCDCYWYYKGELKAAIAKLRTWRNGVYKTR